MGLRGPDLGLGLDNLAVTIFDNNSRSIYSSYFELDNLKILRQIRMNVINIFIVYLNETITII